MEDKDKKQIITLRTIILAGARSLAVAFFLAIMTPVGFWSSLGLLFIFFLLDLYLPDTILKKVLLRTAYVGALAAVGWMVLSPFIISATKNNFPMTSRYLKGYKEYTDMKMASMFVRHNVKTDKAIIDAEAEYEEKVIAEQVKQHLSVGDFEGANKIRNDWNERRLRNEAARKQIEEQKPTTTSTTPYSSKIKTTVLKSGNAYTYRLKPGEDSEMLQTPVGKCVILESKPGSKYVRIYADGRPPVEMYTNVTQVSHLFKIRAIEASTVTVYIS